MMGTGLQDFWESLEALASTSRVVIDHPKGSRHSKMPEMVYPVDSGYMEKTTTLDGDRIKVFLGSQKERKPGAALVMVDLIKQDVELRVLLGCTSEEVDALQVFSRQCSKTTLLIERHPEKLEWLKSRRSVRKFIPEQISREQIESILEAATRAPSAHNRQPWRFIVVINPASRRKLAEELGAKFYSDLLSDGLSPEEALQKRQRSVQRIRSAPLAIILCLDRSELDIYPDAERQQLEVLMAVQSVALAGGQLMLAAHVEGLGAYWKCAPLFAPEATRQVLDLPEHWEPQALILIGRPAVIPHLRSRLPVAEITRFI
jgi:coenzyme F420-0:L-glutamate ligase/coenzyme F420-1:gamma-L-glutamate ligase